MQRSVLIVDDEIDMLFILGETFESNGYMVYKAKDGEEGLEIYRKYSPSIIITDVMMPGKSGIEMVKVIRETDRTVPILFLSSKVSVGDAVEGLSCGANDYIRKPFSVVEVLARANSFINFTQSDKPSSISFGIFTYEPVTRILSGGPENISLTGKEGALLELLAKNLNKTVPLDNILMAIWKDADYFSSRSMHVQIVKLKKLLSSDPNIMIINEKGVGYKMVDLSSL